MILAAGRTVSDSQKTINRTESHFGFPENSKPKCLFHFSGKVLLERQAEVLRECGVSDIRVVVGYKKEMIEKFNEEMELGLKLIFNPTWDSDILTTRGWVKALDSVRAGLRGIEEDVLVILGDVWLEKEGIMKTLRDTHPCVSVWGGHGAQLFKVSKEKLPLLKRLKGTGHNWPLHEFCIANGGVKILTEMHDVDYYNQTDESL